MPLVLALHTRTDSFKRKTPDILGGIIPVLIVGDAIGIVNQPNLSLVNLLGKIDKYLLIMN